MKSKINLLLLIGGMLLCSGMNANEIQLNIKSLGAVANDGKDDSHAFMKAIERIEKAPGNYRIFIPKGEYDIYSRILSSRLARQIAFVGEKGTRINLYHVGGFAQLDAVSEATTLTAAINRNDSVIRIKLPATIKPAPGDLIHVQSNTPFETAWKYKENDIHSIKQVNGGQVRISNKMLFNYDPSKEGVRVVIYKQCKLTFQKIDFVLQPPAQPAKKPTRTTILTVNGVSMNVEDVLFDYVGKSVYFNLGLSAAACYDLNFRNIVLKNMMYGVLMNYCRDVKAFNTKVYNSRHGYAPAQACYNVFVEKLYGENCQSVMDAHPSFLVRYRNVIDTLASEFPNCRSLGTVIEDARIYVKDSFYQTYCYWSVQSLTPEYRGVYAEYDTRFTNVHWVAGKPGNFNGLTSFTCRRLLVENCTTHNVSYYGDKKVLQQVDIRNSRIGVIRIDAQNTLVENTILDGKLSPNAKYVLRFTGSGETKLNKVTIRNYNRDSTYLFDYFYNQQFMNSLSINNSEIGALRGWTNQFIYPGKPYPKIKINASRLADFKEALPTELTTLPGEIKKAKAEKRQ